jgi:hypothetical protein
MVKVMKLTENNVVSISLVLALISLTSPGSSLETDILMMTEHNLSIDIGSEFVLSKGFSSQDGNIFQTIIVNNSTDSNVNASMLMYSLPIYREDLNTTNSSVFSEFMENTMIGLFQLSGGKVVSEVSVKNAWQRNVTSYFISIPKSKQYPKGDDFILATWPIDSRNMVMLISYLGQDDTTKLIETLEVKY